MDSPLREQGPHHRKQLLCVFDEPLQLAWIHLGLDAVLEFLSKADRIIRAFIARDPIGTFVIEPLLALGDEIFDRGEGTALVPALVSVLRQQREEAVVHRVE